MIHRMSDYRDRHQDQTWFDQDMQAVGRHELDPTRKRHRPRVHWLSHVILGFIVAVYIAVWFLAFA